MIMRDFVNLAMHLSQSKKLLCGLVLVLSLTACTSPNTPASQSTSQETTPAVTSEMKIKTATGSIQVTHIQVVDKYPNVFVTTDQQILLVWLKENPDADKAEVGNKYDKSYIVGDDGSKTNSFRDLVLTGDEVALIFTPPRNAHNFTLYWPDSPPIPLVK